MSASLPNFFIAGATASGTSFLTAILLQHRDIYLPLLIKEPHFFSLPLQYEKGLAWYQQTWFSGVKAEKSIGERSTTYFHFPIAAPQLKKHCPEAKFILVLRDPVERAFAQYRYMVLRGKEELDFKTALEEEHRRLEHDTRHFEYKGRSLYGKQLKHFLKFFSRSQILILSSEKLRYQTERQIRRITDFLEIEPLDNFEIPPNFSSPSVKDQALQVVAHNHFGKAFKHIVEGIRFHTGNLQAYVKCKEDAILLDQVKENLSSKKDELPEELRSYLKAYFQQDQEGFFALAESNIDFNSWC